MDRQVVFYGERPCDSLKCKNKAYWEFKTKLNKIQHFCGVHSNDEWRIEKSTRIRKLFLMRPQRCAAEFEIVTV